MLYTATFLIVHAFPDQRAAKSHFNFIFGSAKLVKYTFPGVQAITTYVYLNYAAILYNHIIEDDPSYSRTGRYPVVAARTEVAVARSSRMRDRNKPLPEPPVYIVLYGPLLSLQMLLLAELHLILLRLGKGYDLLHVD